LRAGGSADDALDGLEVDHSLRVVSYLALALGSNAVIAADGQVDAALRFPAGTLPGEGLTGTAIRVAETIRTHLEPTSSVLHNSLRVAVGLALAVLLSQLLKLDHAFWVVLGTLSVLRSNALGTGRTTIQALTGTAAGFAVGATFAALAGTNSGILWAALPIAVFLATYATSAIDFVAGQAAFTVLVIILYNLISPVGWRLGLVRIEDVAIGVGISVVTGLLLWPRGARGELRLAVAGSYRAVANYLLSSFDRIIEPISPDDGGRMRRLAVEARDRAGDAFEQFLVERSAKPLSPEVGASLVAAGTHAIMVGDLMNVVAGMGYQADGCGDGIIPLRAQTRIMVGAFDRLAAQLDGSTSAVGPPETVSAEVLRQAALVCLRQWREDPTRGRAAIANVVVGEWIEELGTQAGDLEEPVSAAVEAARLPWWR
jgi:Fusaric acid resistance protein-like